MGRASIPLLSHYLRRLTARYGDSATDHELLQRFVARREESAFAALVERHAAMVLGLCRSILRNHHDAEDIFQAVFLVLARKAGSIRKGDCVGSWLYAVAYRLAHKARVRAGKRHVCERRAAMPAEQTPMDEVTWGELRDILHEEVSRLPEKYRAAVVLCYWEGRTHEQAGQQLGCAKSTIKDRLEKARAMLRKRLARRGLMLPAAWFAASLSEGTSAAVSVELVQTTVRGALLFSLGQMPEGIVSSKAVACAQSALQTMLVSKLKYGLALVLMLGVLGGGAGMTAFYKMAAPENEPEASATAAEPKNEPEALATEEPLPPGTVARLGTLRFRHSDSIWGIDIGKDGTSILSAAGKAVYVWDLDSGKERRRLQHRSPVSSFVCSGDGKLLASGCRDGTIHVWDAATGREVRSFLAHKDKATDRPVVDGVYLSGFTPDGGQIVSTGPDETLRFWDTASGEKIREFSHFPVGWSVAMSPDGKTLAGVVKNGQTEELRVWEVATGRELQRKPQPGKQILHPVFSPDGKMLAIAVGEKDWQKPCDIQLWDAGTSKVIRTLRGHKGWAWCLFAPDGNTLVSVATSAKDGPARLWDVNTGQEIGRIGDDKSVFNRLLFCPDGRTLVSFTQGYYTFHFWDRASGKEIRSSGDAVTPIDFLSFSPDGRLLATASRSHWVIRLWDVAARKKIRRWEHDLLTAVQFSTDGRRLTTASSSDSHMRIWD
jgi:RNA polymerase sigma factor (sigma-70 family)